MSALAQSGLGALLHDYRTYAGRRLWLALALMLLGALAEGFGILMLVPLASFAIGDGLPAGLAERLSGIAVGIQPGQRMALVLALFVAAMAARSVLFFARDLMMARLESGYEISLRLRAAATLAARGWGFAGGIGQSGMQSLLLNDVPRVSLAVGMAQQLAVGAILLLVQLSLAALLSPLLTLAALAIIVIGAIAGLRWTRRGVRSGMALTSRNEESTGSSFRLHSALKAALAQGTVPRFLRDYRSSLRNLAGEQVRFAADLSTSRSLAFFASAVAAALLFFIGYRLLALPFPVLVTSLVLFARMAGPAQMLQQAIQSAVAHAPSFLAIERRLGKMIGAPEESLRPIEPLEWRELEIQHAAFEHGTGLGLSDVSLTLARGEWIGVGGASGAGKTTLIDLVACLIEPQNGSITVDGEPIAGERLEQWRAALAYVPQEPAVFDDSLRRNLTADSSGAEGDEALWQILEVVGLAKRVRAFPDGLDSRIGDRGSSLSGGERQRLMIGRALLRRPTLLLLDEATAALDPSSEAALLDAIRALELRPAAIVVAHRESTLGHCDSRLHVQHGVARADG